MYERASERLGKAVVTHGTLHNETSVATGYLLSPISIHVDSYKHSLWRNKIRGSDCAALAMLFPE